MKSIVSMIAMAFVAFTVSAEKCAVGGVCPVGFKCNEFNFCIVGEPAPIPQGPVPNGKCNPDGSCPAGQHCNEFKYCVAGVPTPVPETPVPNGKCNPDGSCPAG